MSNGGKGDESITDMAGKLGLDYKVIQTYLWQSGTLPWQGVKSIITRRVRSVKTPRKQVDRHRLAMDEGKRRQHRMVVARPDMQTIVPRATPQDMAVRTFRRGPFRPRLCGLGDGHLAYCLVGTRRAES